MDVRSKAICFVGLGLGDCVPVTTVPLYKVPYSHAGMRRETRLAAKGPQSARFDT